MKWKKTLSEYFINTILIAACATILILNSNALKGKPLNPKYGVYEELEFTEKFAKKLRYKNIKATAGQEVVFRFVKKKHSLSKYPGKAIEAMAWMEILYNEMIKHPKAVREESIAPLWEARNNLRSSMGFESTLSIQEVMGRYLLLSKILSNATTEKQDIAPGLKARKELLKEFKRDLKSSKKTYLASMDDEEIILATDLRRDEITSEIQQTTPEDDSPSTSVTFSTSTKAKERLIELKELLDLGLISEEEFQNKRKKILDDL